MEPGSKHTDLSRKIIGRTMAVHPELRPGLDGKVYENALVVELRERSIECSQQSRFPILYHGVPVGKLIPGLIVDGLIIVDAKVAGGFNQTHIAQRPGYPSITGLGIGPLINFNHSSLKWKRLAKSLSKPPPNPDNLRSKSA